MDLKLDIVSLTKYNTINIHNNINKNTGRTEELTTPAYTPRDIELELELESELELELENLINKETEKNTNDTTYNLHEYIIEDSNSNEISDDINSDDTGSKELETKLVIYVKTKNRKKTELQTFLQNINKSLNVTFAESTKFSLKSVKKTNERHYDERHINNNSFFSRFRRLSSSFSPNFSYSISPFSSPHKQKNTQFEYDEYTDETIPPEELLLYFFDTINPNDYSKFPPHHGTTIFQIVCSIWYNHNNTSKYIRNKKIQNSRIHIIQYMIDNGANVNYVNPFTGATALNYAIDLNDEKVIQILRNHNAIKGNIHLNPFITKI